VDNCKFDAMTRVVAGESSRRDAVRKMAGFGAALLGVRALSASAQEELEAAGNKCKGKNCNKNSNCGTGLVCNNKGKCEYKHGNKGKKGDTCCGSGDCEGGLKCKNNKCKNK